MTNRHETIAVTEDTLKKSADVLNALMNKRFCKSNVALWEHGYEATSISDLTQALEITAPSLYSAFGDKAGLFYKSIDYYLAHEACPIETIFSEAKTAKLRLSYIFMTT